MSKIININDLRSIVKETVQKHIIEEIKIEHIRRATLNGENVVLKSSMFKDKKRGAEKEIYSIEKKNRPGEYLPERYVLIGNKFIEVDPNTFIPKAESVIRQFEDGSFEFVSPTDKKPYYYMSKTDSILTKADGDVLVNSSRMRERAAAETAQPHNTPNNAAQQGTGGVTQQQAGPRNPSVEVESGLKLSGENAIRYEEQAKTFLTNAGIDASVLEPGIPTLIRGFMDLTLSSSENTRANINGVDITYLRHLTDPSNNATLFVYRIKDIDGCFRSFVFNENPNYPGVYVLMEIFPGGMPKSKKCFVDMNKRRVGPVKDDIRQDGAQRVQNAGNTSTNVGREIYVGADSRKFRSSNGTEFTVLGVDGDIKITDGEGHTYQPRIDIRDNGYNENLSNINFNDDASARKTRKNDKETVRQNGRDVYKDVVHDNEVPRESYTIFTFKDADGNFYRVEARGSSQSFQLIKVEEINERVFNACNDLSREIQIEFKDAFELNKDKKRVDPKAEKIEKALRKLYPFNAYDKVKHFYHMVKTFSSQMTKTCKEKCNGLTKDEAKLVIDEYAKAMSSKINEYAGELRFSKVERAVVVKLAIADAIKLCIYSGFGAALLLYYLKFKEKPNVKPVSGEDYTQKMENGDENPAQHGTSVSDDNEQLADEVEEKLKERGYKNDTLYQAIRAIGSGEFEPTKEEAEELYRIFKEESARIANDSIMRAKKSGTPGSEILELVTGDESSEVIIAEVVASETIINAGMSVDNHDKAKVNFDDLQESIQRITVKNDINEIKRNFNRLIK